MIASVSGRMAASGLDWVVVEVGGVGLRLLVPPNTVSDLVTRPKSEPVSLATTMVVREDSLTLYGFDTELERNTFDVLLSVTGIGPRTALAALSVLSPRELSAAVAAQDLTSLQKIPGVGKKSAQRLVLEIGGKLTAFDGEDAAESPVKNDCRGEVSGALEQLGWTKPLIEKTLDDLGGEYSDASSLLRAALVRLGSSRA